MRANALVSQSLGDAPVWCDPKRDEWTLQLTTLTPIFGGGAVVRETGNPPVRAASIRGHLRFWWRATVGAKYDNAAELYAEERKIWGDTDIPGSIGIRVSIKDEGAEASLTDYLLKDPNLGPGAGYFLFPFAENKREDLPAVDGRIGVKFDVQIAAGPGLTQAQREEVKTSVKAWLTLGGIGARTRRGCGALKCMENCEEWLPKSTEDGAYFKGFTHAAVETIIPSVSRGWLLFGNAKDAILAWRDLGYFWSKFRKGHFLIKSEPQKYADACDWDDHANITSKSGDSIQLGKPFLGLPIIYQNFPKDANFSGKFHGEISNGNSGRMASPIILKPILFANGSVCPMVGCLSAAAPTQIRIGNQQFTLTMPRTGQVLRELEANDMVHAVQFAARKDGFNKVLSL